MNIDIVGNNKLLLILATVMIGGIALYGISTYNVRQIIMARCIAFDYHKIFPIDCWGVISISYSSTSNAPRYLVNDHMHEYVIGAVDDISELTVRKNHVYFVDKQPDGCYDNIRKAYCVSFFSHGEIREVYYPVIEAIPTCVDVETNSGEVSRHLLKSGENRC